MRNPDGADDLVQNCLERALNKYQQWKPDRDLRPWLFSIMHNLYVDMVRYQSRTGLHVEVTAAQELTSHAASQEDRLNAQAVLDEINRLPPDYREVLVLIGVNELTYAQAAEVLNITAGTMMSRLNRARVILRQNLNMTIKPILI